MKASQLHGVPYERAACYGKPHIFAHYSADDVRRYEHDDEVCPICHKRLIENTHHQPDRHSFNLKTDWGIFVLKPALFGLCGSGTTGCHGLIEANIIKVRWVWDSDEFKDAWWNGFTLSHGFKPHDRRLYTQGAWEFTRNDKKWRWRGESF